MCSEGQYPYQLVRSTQGYRIVAMFCYCLGQNVQAEDSDDQLESEEGEGNDIMSVESC